MGSSRSNDMLSSLKTKLSNVRQFTTECCIYRVPITLREVNPEAYTPKLVSIGPFHRGTPRLQPMEVHKLQYLQYFLNKDPQKTIEFYVEKMKELEERARRYYDEDINYLTSDQFVEMMLIDGCFIIEFMLRAFKWEPRDSNDFLSTAPSLLSTLVQDMYLLENQLPFFVIERLFKLNNNTNRQNHLGTTFLGLSSKFWGQMFFMGQVISDTDSVKHFVDLLRQCYVPSFERKPPKGSDFKYIPSATELSEAGIKFQKSTQERILNISFNKITGVFSIPPLDIDDTTERLFRNLMALDFFDNFANNHLTDYITIIDALINTSQDVALLRSSGIIGDSLLGDHEEASRVINNLCKGVFYSPTTFYYAGLCQDVNEYYKQPWHLWRAKLKRDYFSNPWSIISLVAALVILICAVVQTILTAKNR